jgi:hypothetical protein
MDPTDTDPPHCFLCLFFVVVQVKCQLTPVSIGRIRSNMEQTGARPRHPAIALSAIPQPGTQECRPIFKEIRILSPSGIEMRAKMQLILEEVQFSLL